MTKSVVCIGEALVDMIELEGSSQPTYLAAWGGSPFNVAVGVARLGSPVEFAGSFGDDALGSRLLGFLGEEEVGTDLSVVESVPTTIAMTSFVDHEPRYTFYANPPSYGLLPAATANRSAVASASVVHAGSLAVLEDQTFDAISQSFSAATGIVTFDPNVRASMVSDWDDYRTRLGALIHRADFVKFSIEDLEAAYPGQSEDAIAMACLDGRASAVLITRGGQDATIFTDTLQSVLPISRGLEVVDTTGGGDATMAALIHQLHQSGLPHDHDGWLRYAHNALSVAAIVCSRRGGAIAMPRMAELESAGLAWN